MGPLDLENYEIKRQIASKHSNFVAYYILKMVSVILLVGPNHCIVSKLSPCMGGLCEEDYTQ